MASKSGNKHFSGLTRRARTGMFHNPMARGALRQYPGQTGNSWDARHAVPDGDFVLSDLKQALATSAGELSQRHKDGVLMDTEYFNAMQALDNEYAEAVRYLTQSGYIAPVKQRLSEGAKASRKMI